jgi:hypothetical protein
MAATKRTTTNNTAENQDQSANNTQATINSAINTSKDAIGGLIGSASQIVLKAAGILEEEIARGIVAARQVEEKFTDVQKIRSGHITENKNLDDLFVRFRKDAHDIIDLVVDFASIAAQNAGKITSQFIKIGSSTTTSSNTSSQQVPLIQVPGELKAGVQTEFPVTLENDNTKDEKNISFVSTPLTDSSGNQLPTSALSFNPDPLKIPPSSKGTVNVKINIPATAKPGSYTSFIQGRDMESLKATLLVKVIS